MIKSIELARKKGFHHKFDFAMSRIWLTKDSHEMVGNYVLIHFMNDKKIFGVDYIACENQSELNKAKSDILNNGFEIDWCVFQDALEFVNEH